MSKRKTKRFGSAPEVHRKNAGRHLVDTKMVLKATRTFLKGGNCAGALNTLMLAERYIGMAHAERKGVGHHNLRAGSNRVFASLARKFKAQCLKPRR